MTEPTLKIYKMYDDVIVPQFQTSGSACMDVHAYFPDSLAVRYLLKGWTEENSNWDCPVSLNREIRIKPGYRVMIPTGMILDIPEGYSVRVHNRSSLPIKQGIKLANQEGIIDFDYFDPFFVVLENTTTDLITISHGDRIAQIEMVPMLKYNVEVTTEKPQPKTDRSGGFGSTGR